MKKDLNKTVDDLKKALEMAVDQLILNASALGLASDIFDEYQPKLKQHFETIIEQTSYKISSIQKTLKDIG